MAEVQTTTAAGEMTLRFIEFVRMHSQNIALFLGKIPHPQTGKPQVNLEVARMLIEHLKAIAYKTRGNLTPDEENVLSAALSGLKVAFAEASQTAGRPPAPGQTQAPEGIPINQGASPNPAQGA